ncbi:MAG: ABC transporter ATP-binding protein [Ilumatobacteraceae bacterium]
MPDSAANGSASANGTAPAVELHNISKGFPGVIANRDISMTVERGTIHAIVGENGAGKSTLMKTLYGLHQPDSGTIAVNGTEVEFSSPSDAIEAGIGMVHQHFMLADNLTVLENIILGAEPAKGGVIDSREAARQITELARSLGVEIDVNSPVAELGVGQRQRVEILKVLYRGAKTLILDEPTAVLVPQEVDELFENLRRLVDAGTTVLFISHKLDEVLAVSSRITVIRQGTTVGTVTPAEVTRRQLAEMMVGSDLPQPEPRTSEVLDRVRLEVNNLSVSRPGRRDLVHDVSFAIRSGEILGVAGVEGNGQFELCSALLGREHSSGTVAIDGKDVSHASVRDRKNAGIAYVPFDRQREGLMLTSSLWENNLLGQEEKFTKYGFVNVAAARAACREVISRFGVLTPNEDVPAFALSGGNQQKLVVGRTMSMNPAVLLAAHPTRGIDVGAQAAVWEEIRTARDAGLAVLLVSADLEELLGLSDRVIVMFEGSVVAELSPRDATPELLGSYMTGAKVAAR